MKLPTLQKPSLPKVPGKLPSLQKAPLPEVSTEVSTGLPEVSTGLPSLKKSPEITKKLPSSPKSPKSNLPSLKKSPKTNLPSSPKSPKSNLPSSPTSTNVKDPRKYLDTFFGTRNNIKGNPIENVNYTLETLTYMTSKNRADQITKIIIDKIGSPFEVWECCAGIGGNSMSFLDNNIVSHLTVFETDLERVNMLRNNMSMYKLDKNITINNSSFNGVSKNETNVSKNETNVSYKKDTKQVMFFDPPWTLPTVKGHESTKEDYLLEGIKVGNKTLEEWVTSCPHCELTVFKVPLGYKLKEIQGFNKEEIPFKNSLLIIVKPNISIKNKEKLEKQKEKERQEYIKWRTELKQFLRNNILPKAVSSPDALDKLVNDDAMKIWEVAFTHESFAPNVGDNYEELELFGDEVMGSVYIKFMLQSYPGITRSQLSEFRTVYLAKKFQSELSKSLGMGPHVRTLFRLSAHVYEDVLESFFGALEKVGDQVFKFGAGMGLAYNMIIAFYKDVEIDWSQSKGNPKTKTKEIFEQLNIVNPKLKEKVPEESVEDEFGNVTVTISVPPLGMQILKNLGINITSPIIAKTTGPTKKTASVEAYIIAVQNLTALGVTKDWIKMVNETKELENPDLYPYVKGIQDRLKTEGYVRFYFNEHHVKGKTGATTGKYIQMIGVKEDGYKKILGSTVNPVESVISGKQEVLKDYQNYIQ